MEKKRNFRNGHIFSDHWNRKNALNECRKYEWDEINFEDVALKKIFKTQASIWQ